MKLTNASRYALQAVVFLATEDKPHPMASYQIARMRHISEKFLLKVLTSLVRAQILLSLKGPNGGFRLARPANKITLLDIIEAVDGPIRGFAPQAGTDNLKLDKQLQTVCDEAADQLRKKLEKVRIGDLAKEK